jgi:quinolinate synthase
MRFAADSDSELSRGYCACLIAAMDGTRPEEVLAVDAADLVPLGGAAAPSRTSTWHNVFVIMQKWVHAAVAAREGRHLGKPFPSLVIGRGAGELLFCSPFDQSCPIRCVDHLDS